MTDILDRIAEAIFLTMLYEIIRQNKIDISKRPIDIIQQEDKIIITAEIPVIFQVKPENVKVTYSNGVLEIIIEKPIIQEAKRLVINAPDTAYVGDKIKIFVRYEDGEVAKNVEIKVVKGNNIITLTTNEEGEASFVPLEEGIYIYTSSIPLSKSTLTTVIKKEAKIFRAEVPLSIKETSTVYITPKTEGEYKVEVYLGDKLITTTKGKGTAMLTLPSGNYKVVVVSEKEIRGMQIEMPFKETPWFVEISDISNILQIIIAFVLLLLLLLGARFYLKWRQEKARKTLEETAREIKPEETKLE